VLGQPGVEEEEEEAVAGVGVGNSLLLPVLFL
jgi:hypothetical protein